MLLRVFTACVVLAVVVVRAQPPNPPDLPAAVPVDRIPFPVPPPAPQVSWTQEECCVGGLKEGSTKGNYVLRGIRSGSPTPCCFTVHLYWLLNLPYVRCPGPYSDELAEEGQSCLSQGLRPSPCCPCWVKETLCCGSCRERRGSAPGNVPIGVEDPNVPLGDPWGAHACCRDPDPQSWKATCGSEDERKDHFFRREDNCVSSHCRTNCRDWRSQEQPCIWKGK